MLSMTKLKKLARQDDWLIDAIKMSGNSDDERPLDKRLRESVAYVAFRPFEQADPEWRGEGEFHPMFHASRMAGSDGVYYARNPVVIYHFGEKSFYNFSQLLALNSSNVRDVVQYYLKMAKLDGKKVVFDAIVRPFVVKINPHKIFAECYDVYKFPANFDVEKWRKS